MTFSEFFRALWGYEPFPWQEAVAERVMRGEWPRIGVPTAAGKTALIDIAVYALAMRAPHAARRIFFVVDRRVIVDEAAARAEKIAKRLLDAAPESELGRLAESLRELGGNAPLETATLRGGIPREDSWSESPLQPLVVCSTVDQIGSALLFRAYGSSEYGRPIRAGLVGNDALIFLDEAHTSRPFAQTLQCIERYRVWAEPLGLPFTVVEMSATPHEDSIRESEADLENETLKRRWEASKRARLVTVEPKDEELTALVEALAREAQAMRKEGAKAIGVIANRVRTARRVHRLLSGDEGADAILLIGRSRPHDRDRIWQEWNCRIALDRKGEAERPVFVVATQCIEVGANLDFDGLVTEAASIDALEQRFGRLDRDGKRGPAKAAIVAQKDQASKKFVDTLYGSAMSATWGWLADHATRQKKGKAREPAIDMGVRALREALRATPDCERQRLAMPTQRAPVLMPAHIDLLSQTSPEPEITPEPAVYLHGPETGPADVQFVWRADLGEDPDQWADIVAMCPPAAGEMLPVPLYAARQWLSGGRSVDLADVEGGAPEVTKREPGEIRPVLWWRGVDESKPVHQADEIRPGMTIVLPSDRGGCDRWGWNPESKDKVYDIGDAVKLTTGQPMLRLHQELARQWKYEDLAKPLRLMEWPLLDEGAREDWVTKAIKALRSSKPKWIADPEKDEQWCAVLSRPAWDQDDVRGSYGGKRVPLAEHLKNCAGVAKAFARGLPERLRQTVALAAEAHDLGKADPRFQAWLRGGNPVKVDELIAKSAKNGQNRAALRRARELAGYPEGGRHELLSVAMLAARGGWTDDIDGDLLLHLVASHHGRCRPFAPVVVDDAPVTVEYQGIAVWSAHGLERVGSGVSERFWKLTRRYGWYGLAYLEAMVRLADQRQSEAEQVSQGKAAHV